MGRLSCQLTACLMPAVVLLCSVYCACGGHLSLGDGRATSERTGLHSKPHCAGHQNHCGRDGSRRDERHDQERRGCGHCESTVAVPPTKATSIDAPAIVPSDVAPLAVIPSDQSTVVAAISRARPENLPPRVRDASLLGLHCALTL